MFNRKQPLEKEWDSFLKREGKMLEKYGRRRESFWEKRLASIVPEGLASKLEEAFVKAFGTVLSEGTGLIEKTYSRERMELEFRAREYRTRLLPTKKNIRESSRKARKQAAFATAAAGVEGAGLGLLGIGLPDIPLFLAALFRSLYTLCLQYGIDYERPKEKELLLEMIELSLLQGEDFEARDAALNRKLYRMAGEDCGGPGRRKTAAGRDSQAAAAGAKEKYFPALEEVKGGREAKGNGPDAPDEGRRKRESSVSEEAVRRAARALSGELLYLKFLQGVAVVGVIGGVYDSIYMRRITKYAALKMERRYLLYLSEQQKTGKGGI